MFKIGDKVKVVHLDDIGSISKSISVGMIGEVIDIENDPSDIFPYYVRFGKEIGSTWFKENELKALGLRVYIAAPFFSTEQINKVKRLEDALDQNQTIQSYFSPRKVQNLPGLIEFTSEWANAIAMNDYKEVKNADIVIAITDFDGQDTDSGTAAEIGFAYGINKDVYLINFNQIDDMVNLMLTEVANAYFTNIDDVAKYDFNKKEKIEFNGNYR